MYKFIKYFSTMVILSINIYGCNTPNVSVNSNTISQTDYTPMQKYQSWITNLSNSDYSVSQGSIFLMKNNDCTKFVSIFNSCFGQNPAAPYIIPELPVESSYVDPHYATELLDNGPLGESTTNILYRLNNNDAMMVLVYYPPNAAYFGYQSYVFSRDAINYNDITPLRARTISPNPNRYELFASIGNDINNVVIKNQYLSPWNGNVILYITTPNPSLAAQLVANATANGINPNSIFVEPVGDNVITGDGEAADDLITLIRYAMIDPSYTEQAADWENSLSSNILVYKVTNPNVAKSNYPTNQYTPHSFNNDETNLKTALSQLSELLKAYLEKNQSGTIEATISPLQATETNSSEGSPDSGLVGATCIQYGVNCYGDNQDTATYATLTDSALLLGPNETDFIVGVNHSVTNNNSYLSIGIYNASTQSGIASSSQTNKSEVWFSSGNLNDSAKNVLSKLGIIIPDSYSELYANIDKLYITFISRNCNNQTIAAASDYCIDLMGTSLLPSYTTPITIFERAYVLPGQTSGANVNYMIYPNIIAAKKTVIYK